MHGVIEKFDLYGFSGWVKGDVGSALFLNVYIDGADIPVVSEVHARTDIGLGYGFTANFCKSLENYPNVDGIEVNVICDAKKFRLSFYEPARLAVQLARLSNAERTHLVRNLDFQTRNMVLDFSFGDSNLPMVNSNKRSVCVVTYANSSGGWFDYFYNHYINHQEVDGLYIVTPKPGDFSGYTLDGVISVEGAEYNDYSIANFLSCLSNGLKSYYKYVLVCDVDELISPAPNSGLTLKQFADQSSEGFYITLGIDVIQAPEEDVFDLGMTVAENRAFGILNSAICKPCFTSSVVRYFIGQHYCNFPAHFLPWKEGLVCYHMKWACADMRNNVLGIVEKTVYAFDDIARYSRNSVGIDLSHPAWNASRNKICEIESTAVDDFKQRFVNQRFYNSNYGVFSGNHFLGDFLVRLV